MHLIFLWLAAAASHEPSDATEALAGVDEVVTETKLATFVPIRMSWRLANAFKGFPYPEECGPIQAAIRLGRSAIWVGTTVGDHYEIRNLDGARDWASLAAVLREYASFIHFKDRGDIELAAEPDVTAVDIARALRVAVESGFARPHYVFPGWESPLFHDSRQSLDERFPLRTIGLHSVVIAIHEDGVVIGSDTGTVELVPSRRGRHDLEAIFQALARARQAAGRHRLTGRHLMSTGSSWSPDGDELVVAVAELGYRWVEDSRLHWIHGVD